MICVRYRDKCKRGAMSFKFVESRRLLAIFQAHSKLFLQIFWSFLRYFAILRILQSVGKCIRNTWQRKLDCKYLIRTENHFGKFDIFILFYFMFKENSRPAFIFFMFAQGAHTGFKHMWAHVFCTYVNTRGHVYLYTRVCVAVCVLELVCVCVCELRKCVQAENAHSLIYFMLEICTFVPTSTETLDVHFWLSATRT